ncbi:polymerase delta-interacting protein 3 [Pseudolycoriella hygida]|uniref:Polymerase delta-interacting protein 3 n=1 Tax=Pseudolycoriella hygida TaxID=35572 RepID=A0A9Q0S0T7_9DIPT|nr:polymerase delta-interacting protein 3 [Pseudolycoriella hygida]
MKKPSRALSPSSSLQHGHGGYVPDENSHLSYEMRTRLKNMPDSNMSMGMFSNPYTKPMLPPKTSGYRIVVSNLHSSVSQSDIKELFEDIGTLVEARLVRTGVAEVIYSSMKDAETAVDTYHNRQLDGQPMKCLLVNPRSIENKPTAPAIKRSELD